MSQTIDLAQLTEEGFATLYRERIAPLLGGAENERLDQVRGFRLWLGIGAAAAIAVGAATTTLSGNIVAGVVLAACGLIIAYTLAYQPLRAFGVRVKTAVLSAIAQGVGVAYVSNDEDFPPFQRFCTLGLVPGHDGVRFEDVFKGVRQGCAYELSEAILDVADHDPSGGQSTVTVFRGQLVRIAFPRPFHGRTVIRHAAEALAGEDGLQPVEIGHLAFSVASDDAAAARKLAHPVLLDRLAELEKAFKGRNLRCAFDAGDLLLTMDCPDRFEIGDLFAPLADPARARRIVDDIAQVLKLIDAVLAA